MNDACMQALGSYEGGKMLYLGLGTGLRTAFIIDGVICPLALGHLALGGRVLQPFSQPGWTRDARKKTLAASRGQNCGNAPGRFLG